MKLFIKISFFIVAIFLLFTAGDARASGYCFCSGGDFKQINTSNISNVDNLVSSACFTVTDLKDCLDIKTINNTNNPKIPFSSCKQADSGTACSDYKKQWEILLKFRLESIKKAEAGVTEGLQGKIMPKCVTEDILSPECRDIGVFIVLGINIASYLFSFIGALALLMFVYGGFVLILSQGSQEKVKSGTGIILAAVIGLLIAFSGYLLIQFLGKDVLKVQKVAYLISDWLIS